MTNCTNLNYNNVLTMIHNLKNYDFHEFDLDNKWSWGTDKSNSLVELLRLKMGVMQTLELFKTSQIKEKDDL